MEKFEYKVVTYDTGGFAGGKVDALRMEEQLNLIGNDGWEMVSCTSLLTEKNTLVRNGFVPVHLFQSRAVPLKSSIMMMYQLKQRYSISETGLFNEKNSLDFLSMEVKNGDHPTGLQ